VVAAADEIAPGERKIVTVAGRSIGVFNVGGEYFALRNRCPHQGGALCEGQLWGVLQSERPGQFDYQPSREILACPWHGWEFHLRTGQSWCAPEKLRVNRYAVAAVSGADLVAGADSDDAADASPPAPGMVKGPYVAETFPVKRDGAYLVVELPAGARPSRFR
jgi:3-phenylpropionate/trans-cinnamate dioxygenase ferredoxin subunit